jgi:hypothetical protein
VGGLEILGSSDDDRIVMFLVNVVHYLADTCIKYTHTVIAE